MATNVPPQYKKAEDEYRRAQTPQEAVECLELMLKLVPKHKASEKLQADLKTRLKEAKAECESEKKAPKKTKSTRIPRQGAGQVILVGGPNAGKSRVLKELTNAHPEVAPYPFTTREAMPGMMPWADVKVQLVDTPPMTADHVDPALTSLVRSADLVVLCVDGSTDDGPDQAAEVIAQLRDRKTLLDTESGLDEENLSLVRVRTIVAATRARDGGFEDRLNYFREVVPTPFTTVLVEFDSPNASSLLAEAIYRALDVIRVYTKLPGKPADMKDPFTLPSGSTIMDLAEKVHRDLPKSLKYAKVWGEGVFDGESVGADHVLADKNVVELHK